MTTPTELITPTDEHRALRLVLGMIAEDETACRAAVADAIDAGRHSHLLIATARYAATLTSNAVPDPQEQLQRALLALAAGDHG